MDLQLLCGGFQFFLKTNVHSHPGSAPRPASDFSNSCSFDRRSRGQEADGIIALICILVFVS